MKYFVILLFIFCSLNTSNTQAQFDPDQIIQEFLEMRRKMLEDSFFGPDIDDDNFFDKIFDDMHSLNSNNAPLEYKWNKNEDESALVIVPSSENIQLEMNINAKDNQIELSTGSQNNIYKTFLSIPQGHDASKAKTEKIKNMIIICIPKSDKKNACSKLDKHVISFQQKPKIKNPRPLQKKEEDIYLKPLRPKNGDITI